jgi:serine protease Do
MLLSIIIGAAVLRAVAADAAQLVSGTGFFVSPDGYVLTAHHVVAGARQVALRTPSGEIWQARVVKTDPENDIALLRVETLRNPVPYLRLRPSTQVRRGEAVFTIGFPMIAIQGTEPKLTNGIVSRQRIPKRRKLCE